MFRNAPKSEIKRAAIIKPAFLDERTEAWGVIGSACWDVLLLE
jgi:hypothetical protein